MSWSLSEILSAARELGYESVMPDIEDRIRAAFHEDPSGNAATRIMITARLMMCDDERRNLNA